MRKFVFCTVVALTAFSTLEKVVLATHTTSSNRRAQPGRYIVVLKDDVNITTHKSWIREECATTLKANKSSTFHVTNEYHIFHGYAADLTNDVVAKLTNNSEVSMVVPDMPCYGQLTQANAPWGISRISRKTKLPPRPLPHNANYIFRYKPSRTGVDVYVLDTGVNTAHVDFGGRAEWGTTFGKYANEDGSGHGTHVAGIIGGKRYGVAKSASIIAVKVLGDNNAGWVSDIIAGINWATIRASTSGRPSVINISISTEEPNTVLDLAVTNAVNRGMHIVVAAGSTNQDSSVTSPARAPAVLTVGAMNIDDERWVRSPSRGSNFGPGVDVFAPGHDIISTWIGSNTATNRLTGTSVAAPHVAGLVAYLLSVEGALSPVEMDARIKQLAPRGVLTKIPVGTS
ncbi:alkaline protease 2 [Ceratobasidium sp. AG-Ba]|nr:alkaline protease 2 [Ceratobasidium sp. AG-Ba]